MLCFVKVQGFQAVGRQVVGISRAVFGVGFFPHAFAAGSVGRPLGRIKPGQVKRVRRCVCDRIDPLVCLCHAGNVIDINRVTRDKPVCGSCNNRRVSLANTGNRFLVVVRIHRKPGRIIKGHDFCGKVPLVIS